MIFLRISCPNFIGLVWRPPYLPLRFRRHCLARHQLSPWDCGYGARDMSAYAPTVTDTHCAYPLPQMDCKLTWVAGYLPIWFTCPDMVTHPTTNWTRRISTALILTGRLSTLSCTRVTCFWKLFIFGSPPHIGENWFFGARRTKVDRLPSCTVTVRILPTLLVLSLSLSLLRVSCKWNCECTMCEEMFTSSTSTGWPGKTRRILRVSRNYGQVRERCKSGNQWMLWQMHS